MRPRATTSLLVLLLAAMPAAAQRLPDTFGKWAAAGPVISGLILENGTRVPAAVLNEYGLISAQQRTYVDQTETLQISLYTMRDPSAAYGAYSFLRTADMAHASITEHSSLSRTRALAVAGNSLLDVTAKDLASLQSDLKNLAAELAPHAARGPYPTLWQHLPLNGLVPRSDRYLAGPVALHELLPLADGDWLGFANGAEAELARYRVVGRGGESSTGEELTLLLADYPTPQLATLKLEELAKRFNLDSTVTEGPNGAHRLFARRASTLVAVVANAPSQAAADAILSQIHNESALTWNEPGFSFTDPGIAQMIVGTIIGTGILCMFALIAGIAFGGVRLVVKRLLPDRVFDRSSTMQILQLGLSSKPIEAKDFYYGGSR